MKYTEEEFNELPEWAKTEILKEGLKIISSGTGDYTDGDGVRSSDTQLSAKSEAHLSLANG